MLRTLGIVHACFDGEGPNPIGSRKLGGRPVLEWIVRRVTDCQRLEGTVVLTDDSPGNAFVSGLVPLDVPVFVARRSDDALSRLITILDECPAEHLVCISCRYPFLDPVWIDRLVTAAESAEGTDFASFASTLDPRAELSIGLDVRWMSASAVRRLDRKFKSASQRNDLDSLFRSAQAKCKVLQVRPPIEIADDRLRLVLENDEAWEEALTILESLGTEGLDWQRIADLLDHQPSMHFRVAPERANTERADPERAAASR